MMPTHENLKVIMLNCTLKKSPAPSHTKVLMKKVAKLYRKQNITVEMIRVVDHHIPFGISSNEGKGDEWPKILRKLKTANIIVMGMPIWFGVRSSVAQMVIERLDGTYEEGDKKTGQISSPQHRLHG